MVEGEAEVCGIWHFQRKMLSGGDFRQCCDHGQQFTTSAHRVKANEEGVTAIVDD
jgi:hypothetical protein